MALTLRLPTFHSGQVEAFNKRTRRYAMRCGRRFGKTALLATIAVDRAVKKYPIGIFAPDNGKLRETFTDIREMLGDLKLSANRNEGVIRTVTGGRIDFWSLENDNPARGRKYKLAMIDEAAFTKPTMMDTWKRAIEPTLFDYSGACIVASNTNGEDPDNFFWRICNQPEHGFTEHHAPTHANPLLPLLREGETEAERQVRRVIELEKLKTDNPPLVYQQEYLAEFVDWSGAAFFSLDSLMADMGGSERQPYPMPGRCDFVVAIVDTAVKTGSDNDGTAVGYYAFTRGVPAPLMILDWDIVQIEGDLLVTWLPGVFARLEQLASECNALMGSAGAFIEDKQTGSTLIMAAQRRSWPVNAIDTKLTAVGKDERAIAASPYVFQRQMGITQYAYDKQVKYKGDTRNHMVYQVTRFRIGDKDNKRPDDLLDVFVYAPLILLGNSKGI